MIETLEQRLEAAGLLEEVLNEFEQMIVRCTTVGFLSGREAGFVVGVVAATEFAHRGD